MPVTINQKFGGCAFVCLRVLCLGMLACAVLSLGKCAQLTLEWAVEDR